MKNFLIRHLPSPLAAPAPTPVEDVRDMAVEDIMAATRRELALFASEQLGAQVRLGQYGPEFGGEARLVRNRFRDLIEQTGEAFMVIDPRPGLHIVDINQPYADATLTRRGKVAGDKLFQVFPDNPDDPSADGVAKLFESVQQAARSGKPHAMAAQRYDVRDDAGHFVQRVWRPVNTPIFDENGRLLYILHQAHMI